MFARFKCGCKGLHFQDYDVILWDCEYSEYSFKVLRREVREDFVRPLTQQEAEELINNVDEYLRKAKKAERFFLQLRTILDSLV